MKCRKYFLISCVILLIFINFSPIKSEEICCDSIAIRKALLYQNQHYPVSQYRDVYKNFMQDFYGPGHIIKDKPTACDGIKKEMSNVEFYDGPDYEPTGFQGNFYRVNLRLIAENIVPYEIFLNAFIESVQGINPPSGEMWMGIWKEIDKEIQNMNWHFENEEKDRNDLESQFKEGNYVVHHSGAYNEAVNFHYRIISKENFEKIILPYLNKR